MNEQLKREELRKMIEVNPNSVIGMKCRGFMFDIPQEWDDDRMGKLEGKEGVIWMLSYQSFILIKFEDEFYPYPINEIHNHIILEESKPTFIPTSMPCTQEQFESIKQRLLDGGCEIEHISGFDYFAILVNNLSGIEKMVSNLRNRDKKEYNRTYYPKFNPEIFLRNCGIELKKEVTQEFPKDDFGVVVQDNAKEIIDYLVSKGFSNSKLFAGIANNGDCYYIEKNRKIIRHIDNRNNTSKTFTLSELKSLDTPKIFTCKDLSEGRVACINDGTIEELRKVLNYFLPNDSRYFNGFFEFYFNKENDKIEWGFADTTDLPTQSVKVFLKEIEDMEEFEKGLDANAKEYDNHETPIEKAMRQVKENIHTLPYLVEAPKEVPQKLYSVYMSLGKIRVIYIDLTDEDVDVLKKNNPNWFTMVIEQGNDRGIKVEVKPE